MSALAEPCPPNKRTHEALIAERLGLLNNGYAPTPCDGKRALLDGWASLHAPTERQINEWIEFHPRCQNTGILTRLTTAFDIDILNEDAAQAVEDLIVRWFAKRGIIIVRVGQWPKRLILFWTDAPFKKLAITFVKGGKLEVLCDGQQFVAFGIDPGHSPALRMGRRLVAAHRRALRAPLHQRG